MAAVVSQLDSEIGRLRAEWRSKPNSIQTFDNPWYDPKRDTPEMFAVEINAAGLVVRAIALSLSGQRPSLEAAIDESVTRHTTGEAILAEWIDAADDAGTLAADLLIRLARSRGEQPDQSWRGEPTHTIYSYPPHVERWGNVVSYDSGRSTDEGLDWVRTFGSIEEAQAAFRRSVR